MSFSNRISKFFLEIIYLIVPTMLLNAPFHQGGYSFFEALRNAAFVICFLFALFTFQDRDGYFANANSRYPLIFIIIAFIYNPFLVLHLNRQIWTGIDILSGIFMLWYFIERKIYHRTNPSFQKELKEQRKNQEDENQRIRNLNWCKTCKHYRKNKLFENPYKGTHLNQDIPDPQYLPCGIFDTAKHVWEDFYGKPEGERTLFPLHCPFWEPRKSFFKIS